MRAERENFWVLKCIIVLKHEDLCMFLHINEQDDMFIYRYMLLYLKIDVDLFDSETITLSTALTTINEHKLDPHTHTPSAMI